jgi:hypothetical protein
MGIGDCNSRLAPDFELGIADWELVARAERLDIAKVAMDANVVSWQSCRAAGLPLEGEGKPVRTLSVARHLLRAREEFGSGCQRTTGSFV